MSWLPFGGVTGIAWLESYLWTLSYAGPAGLDLILALVSLLIYKGVCALLELQGYRATTEGGLIDWDRGSLEDDEEHMPPEGKPGFEEPELVVLKWWLDEGGDPAKTAGELNLTDEIRAAIGKLDLGIALIETAIKEVVSDLPSDDLRATVAKLGAEFPGGLTFESQSTANLTFTGVSMRKNLSDELFAKLTSVIPNMVAIDLSATSGTDASIALLASAPNLRMVRLSETEITDASMDTLAKLTKLESVNLYGTKVTDAGVKKLSALPNLKRLYLWQTAVTPEAIAELKKTLPELEIVTGV